MKRPPPILVPATPEQLQTAKARLRATVLAAASEAGATLNVVAPHFRSSVDALPDLRPSFRLAPEVRVLLLVALYKAGVTIPEEVWKALQMTSYKSVVVGSVLDQTPATEMTTVWVDFNARTENDCVRLDTVGSKQSLIETGVSTGAWVWVSDGELRARAQIEDCEGRLVARVLWKTIEDLMIKASPEVTE